VFNDIKRLQKLPEEVNIIGKIKKSDEKNLTVIGSRRMSRYGQNVIENLVPLLVNKGFTIVSGLAVGCDSHAQKVALDCGGRTIGVLGYGLNKVKSDRNYEFIKRVLDDENGVVISPFKRHEKPSRESFIYRNSMMAAIGNAVLVIEAMAKSGTFHTVNFALDLGKDIMAVPGNVFTYNSAGVHKLIKEGAALVDRVEDIEAVLGINEVD
jgi:DNA processing protein